MAIAALDSSQKWKYVSIIIGEESTLFKLHEYLLSRLKEKYIHVRKFSRRKKKMLYSALEKIDVKNIEIICLYNKSHSLKQLAKFIDSILKRKNISLVIMDREFMELSRWINNGRIESNSPFLELADIVAHINRVRHNELIKNLNITEIRV